MCGERSRRRSDGWRRLLWSLLLGSALAGSALPSCATTEDDYACTAEDNLALFKRKIQPLLSDEHPSSCNQCHLTGVNLAAFARETPCETMACLEAEGLADPDDPDNSLVLAWIARAAPSSPLSPSAASLEFQAFRSFLRYQSECGDQVCAGVTCSSQAGGDVCVAKREPAVLDIPDEGGCDDKQLEQLFADSIYRWRGRCYPCHFDSTKPEDDAPKWINASQVCDVASLATLHNVESSGYIRTDKPEKSWLLLKPLAEEAGGVEHGGHTKFKDQEDVAYQAFLYFIQRYAECKNR
ncbi:MAG: hypothetical protein KC766_14695 [Myxococcales bacterium]|nr:hypothetical protein [Myxococcales bacterium]